MRYLVLCLQGTVIISDMKDVVWFKFKFKKI
jgi:hypothetical protein